jgi:hypothetical protein
MRDATDLYSTETAATEAPVDDSDITDTSLRSPARNNHSPS